MRQIPMGRSITRRRILQKSLWALPLSLWSPTLLAAPGVVVAASRGEACPATASQTEGPYYPVRPIEFRNNLILPAGKQEKAQGEAIVVKGTVTDARCQPIRNAEVQLWQADSHGLYHHPSESRDAPLDTRFLYWGMARTDSNGEYRFLTILPAPYGAGGGWMRPPHIHFKFRNSGGESLTTQMYFPGHPLNHKDYLLQNISAPRRGGLIARHVGAENGSAVYQFNVVL